MPGVEAGLPGQGLLQPGEELGAGDLGEEAQRAQVDPEDRHRPAPEDAGGVDEGPVAAEDQHQLGPLGNLRHPGRRPAGVGGQLRLGEDLQIWEPGTDVPGEVHGLGASPLHDDGERLHLRRCSYYTPPEAGAWGTRGASDGPVRPCQ